MICKYLDLLQPIRCQPEQALLTRLVVEDVVKVIPLQVLFSHFWSFLLIIALLISQANFLKANIFIMQNIRSDITSCRICVNDCVRFWQHVFAIMRDIDEAPICEISGDIIHSKSSLPASISWMNYQGWPNCIEIHPHVLFLLVLGHQEALSYIIRSWVLISSVKICLERRKIKEVTETNLSPFSKQPLQCN